MYESGKQLLYHDFPYPAGVTVIDDDGSSFVNIDLYGKEIYVPRSKLFDPDKPADVVRLLVMRKLDIDVAIGYSDRLKAEKVPAHIGDFL